MMEPDAIRALIEAALPGSKVTVSDDAGDKEHFQAVVVSPAFEGKNRIEQHRLVYAALGSHMHSDIHALALKTYPASQEPR